ncbi:MAG: YifB family Mg chelatase-like AAA ATPase [Corynebacteriales bacterium]|nr:YifB family Mg chelatase-like AAA ATPase [Mycobacteriales bacterium]
MVTGFARTHAVGLHGVHGHLIEVEAHLAHGLPNFIITGLGDTAVVQARDRVRAAVVNSDQPWPPHRTTVGLSPAWLPKRGSAYDLAVAIAVLSAAGCLDMEASPGTAFCAELGLDGRLRPVQGVLPAIMAAVRAGCTRVVVPHIQAPEAALVPGARVIGATDLREVVGVLRGEVRPRAPQAIADVPPTKSPCISEVAGQEIGRLAMEVAAAGGHHVAFFGPPGAGKTLLAERLPGLLPRLTDEQALEVTALHSIAGKGTVIPGLMRVPPFQAPHHTATSAALVGGGAGVAQPGALSLAHHGVLFLDEATEFAARTLDALREPLERQEVTLARAGGVVTYPAQVQLVLAANPCPCGAGGQQQCECGPSVRRRYLGRLSVPLLDRIDIQVTLPPVSAASLYDQNGRETTAQVAARVEQARSAAAARWAKKTWDVNARVSAHALRADFRLPMKVSSELDRALEQGLVSARGYDRVLRVAWTLADLSGRSMPVREDIALALAMRLRTLA